MPVFDKLENSNDSLGRKRSGRTNHRFPLKLQSRMDNPDNRFLDPHLHDNRQADYLQGQQERLVYRTQTHVYHNMSSVLHH